MANADLKPVADFFFEVGQLARTPRSFTGLLGSGRQSVAEHLCRASYIGYALAHGTSGADEGKVMRMCLFHDVAEARTSDLNYVNQKYVTDDEEKVLTEIAAAVPFGHDMKGLIGEWNEGTTPEAQLARDADQLELLCFLKEQFDAGNPRAERWVPSLVARLKTDAGREIAKKIWETRSDGWCFQDLDDPWWVNGGKQKHPNV